MEILRFIDKLETFLESHTALLFVIIILLEASRWKYDVWWQRREEHELSKQTKLLEDIRDGRTTKAAVS